MQSIQTTVDPLLDENRRIRMLRMASDLLIRTILTSPVSLPEVESMVSGVRKLALHLFPDKGEVFDLIYLPRFRRALREAGLVNPAALTVLDGGLPHQSEDSSSA